METMNQESVYYLEKAPVSRAILHMVLPMLLSFIATVIYNITDAYFIGRLNNTSMMASVTLALPFSTVLMGLGHLFGAGSGTYISRLLGEKNMERIKYVSSINLWSSVFIGIVCMAVSHIGLSSILELLGAKGEALVHTKNYVSVFILASPFVIGSISLEEAVRAEGASVASMTGMILGVVLNIILDPIFIFILHMGIVGAAVATVLGNVASMVWYIYYLQKKSTVQNLSIKYFKPTKEIYITILKVGVASFLFDAFMVVISLLYNNYSMLYGDSAVASLGIAQRIIQLMDAVSMSFAMGSVPLIAYAYSAKNNDRLMEIIKKTIGIMSGIILSIALIIFALKAQIMGVFTNDNQVIEIGQRILLAQVCSTSFAALAGIFTGIFQAFGVGTQSTVMAILRGLLFIPIIIIGNMLFQLDGIIWSMTISEGVTALVGIALWFGIKEKILNHRLVLQETE